MAICDNLELESRLKPLWLDEQDNGVTGGAHSLQYRNYTFVKENTVDGNHP